MPAPGWTTRSSATATTSVAKAPLPLPIASRARRFPSSCRTPCSPAAPDREFLRSAARSSRIEALEALHSTGPGQRVLRDTMPVTVDDLLAQIEELHLMPSTDFAAMKARWQRPG